MKPTVLGLAIGYGSNFLNVLHVENRLVLGNGSHRAYALRDLGIAEIPCLVQRVNRRDELDLVASGDLASSPDRYLKSVRPPMLRDYFDPALRKIVPVYRKTGLSEFNSRSSKPKYRRSEMLPPPPFCRSKAALARQQTSREEYYLDVKSAELAEAARPRVWVKSISKDKASLVMSYEADCKSRRLNQVSVTAYDAAEKLVSSSDVETGWQAVVPGTIGEQLYNGMCSNWR